MISDILEISHRFSHSLSGFEFARLLAFVIISRTLYSILYILFLYPLFISPLRHLPGPKENSLIFGQGFKLLRAPWIPYLYRDWAAQWPEAPFIRYRGVGNSETLVASSIEAYREILQTKNDYFVKPPLTRKIANTVIGDGLPFAEGQVHRQQKAVFSRLFSVNNVKSYVPTIQSKAARLVDMVAPSSRENSVAQVETGIWKTTLDLIGIKVLGTDLNHLESADTPFYGLFSRTMKQSLLSHTIHYFSPYLPLRHLIPIKTNNDFIRDTQETRCVIRRHLESRSKSGDQNTDTDALRIMGENFHLWNDGDAIEHALNLLVLGHDTTACSIVWAVHELSKNLEYQEQLRNETINLRNQSRKPKFDDIEKLEFLDHFIREVLRVYCPVAYVPREATSDVVIAGISIPKGTIIHLSPAVMNMHPRIWGEDAASFNPERWQDLKGDAANAYAFQTFHNGTRVCIGKMLSMIEMKVIVMELISRFRIEAISQNREMEFASPSFTLRPKNKLHVHLTEL